MRTLKRQSSKSHLFLLLLCFIILSSFVSSFTVYPGIYGDCDTQGLGRCVEWQYFGFGTGGLHVRESDTLGLDDECSPSYRLGVILDKNGALSDIQAGSCSSPDGPGDNPQDVLWTSFGQIAGGYWGFGRDVFVDYSGSFVLCDEVGIYIDLNGGKWRCDGTDFFACSGQGQSCSSGCCSGHCSSGRCCPDDTEWDGDSCELTSVCTPNEVKTTPISCGKCGVWQQKCNAAGDNWSNDVCVNEGPCSSGDADSRPCQLGVGTETRTCTSSCAWGLWDVSGCVGSTCGNGVRDSGEDCEGSDLNGQNCVSQGCTGGTLGCYPDGNSYECQFDRSSCTGCGPTTCSGTRCDGVSVTLNIGQQDCATDLANYECTSTGWSPLGTSCAPCPYVPPICTCPGGTKCDGTPVCGALNQVVCGTDLNNWECKSTGWSPLGTSCAPCLVSPPPPPPGGEGFYCREPSTLGWGNSICDVTNRAQPYQLGATCPSSSLDYILSTTTNDYICNEGWTPGECGGADIEGFHKFTRTLSGDLYGGWASDTSIQYESRCASGITNTVTINLLSCSPSETSCSNGADEDCDAKIDCADTDCAGLSAGGGNTCCTTWLNCSQDDCVAESCVGNLCQYSSRGLCDSSECSPGQFCDGFGGNCDSPDLDSNVCLNCAPDLTSGMPWIWVPSNHQDAGKGYNNNLFDSNSGPCLPSSCTKAGNPCNCYNATGGAVNHLGSLASGNCCGNNQSEYYKPDYYGPECTSDQKSCIWSTGDAQASDTGNAQWWCFLHEWNQCNDTTIGSGIGGVCCAGEIGDNAWIPNTQPKPPENLYSCTDGFDNDCDGAIDCADSDCGGIISGTVRNQNNNPVSSASILARENLNQFGPTTTNQAGQYSIGVDCGIFTVSASHPDYWPAAAESINVSEAQNVVVDFNLLLGTSCESDCTYIADDIIHASCRGYSNCTFYDDRAMDVCDYSKPGWLRDYNETHYVVCASGSPISKVEVQTSLSCSSGTLVKVTRIVVYNGKPVKLIVATCG